MTLTLIVENSGGVAEFGGHAAGVLPLGHQIGGAGVAEDVLGPPPPSELLADGWEVTAVGGAWARGRSAESR